AVAVSAAPAGDGAAASSAGGAAGGRGGRGGRAGGGAAAPADTGTGATPRRITFTARVEIDHRAERKQVFDESWRVMKHRFYDPAMHGVDWERMRNAYEPLLEYVGDREELQDVISEMIGELNASHTGISGGGRPAANDQTRYPGFELEPDASGYH